MKSGTRSLLAVLLIALALQKVLNILAHRLQRDCPFRVDFVDHEALRVLEYLSHLSRSESANLLFVARID